MKIGTLDITNCKIGSTQVNEVRIGSTLVWQFSSLDPDAQAFITAAGITNPTQQTAINTLVVSLKANGIWSKMKALYPFVGGSAASHKFNLKDPRDLNAAYRLVFNGGWTHSSTGALANGTNTFADTFFSINTLNQNNSHISIYNTNNYGPYATGSIDMGAFNEITSNGTFIATEVVPGLSRARLFKNPLDFSLTDNRGYFLVNSNATNSQYYINNIVRSTIANSGVFPLDNLNIYIGNLRTNVLLTYFASGRYTFSSIGDGLSATEASNFYTAVQSFQTTLGRQV
jgi:hypothetical protein